MAFDLSGFSRQKFEPRQVTVSLPELKAFFDDAEDPVFTVRGLTGEEFYSVREATQKRADFQAIATRILSGAGDAIAEALEEYYGAVPDEFARRVEVVVFGTVEPNLDRHAAMKLFKYYPTAAHTLAENILRATGEGATPGELKGCGATAECATT